MSRRSTPSAISTVQAQRVIFVMLVLTWVLWAVIAAPPYHGKETRRSRIWITDPESGAKWKVDIK